MMVAREDWVIIPAKSFGEAKTRLAGLLSAPERAQLARAMLGDVLTAASGLAGRRRVGVITASDEVAALAVSFGAIAIDDGGARSVNAAVLAGLRAVAARGCGGILVAPADVPCALPSDMEAMFAAAERAHVAIAPAQRDGGTNALACDIVGRIEPCFDPDSFNRHIAAAESAGLRPAILANARLGLDIDVPADLFSLLATDMSSGAAAYLRSLRLELRVDRHRPGLITAVSGAQIDGVEQRDTAVATPAKGPTPPSLEVRK